MTHALSTACLVSTHGERNNDMHNMRLNAITLKPTRVGTVNLYKDARNGSCHTRSPRVYFWLQRVLRAGPQCAVIGIMATRVKRLRARP
jgi:hypothetical protein